MTIGVLKEPSYESRVYLLPEAVVVLTKKGMKLLIETGAGDKAFASDDLYKDAGAAVGSAATVFAESEVIMAIQVPASLPAAGNKAAVLMGVYQPLYNAALMQQWAGQGWVRFYLSSHENQNVPGRMR